MSRPSEPSSAVSARVDNELRHGAWLAAEETERVWGWGTPAGRRRAERRGALIAQCAALGPGRRALEVGAGTGIFTEIFARTGADVVAVDLSPDLLSKARVRLSAFDRVRLLEKRFEDCDEDGPFDAVIGSSVLHHLELEPALRRIAELLAPGGVLCFAEPNMLNPQIFAERKFRRFFPAVSPDETAFVRWTLARSLAAAGFRNVQITPFDWLHPAVPAPFIGMVSTLGRGLEALPGAREFAGSLLIRAEKSA